MTPVSEPHVGSDTKQMNTHIKTTMDNSQHPLDCPCLWCGVERHYAAQREAKHKKAVALSPMLPWTPSAKKILRTAQEVAAKYEHHYAGGEHLLAGVFLQSDSPSARLLERHGMDMPLLQHEFGWDDRARQLEAERERTEYERLREKFESQDTP